MRTQDGLTEAGGGGAPPPSWLGMSSKCRRPRGQQTGLHVGAEGTGLGRQVTRPRGLCPPLGSAVPKPGAFQGAASAWPWGAARGGGPLLGSLRRRGLGLGPGGSAGQVLRARRGRAGRGWGTGNLPGATGRSGDPPPPPPCFPPVPAQCLSVDQARRGQDTHLLGPPESWKPHPYLGFYTRGTAQRWRTPGLHHLPPLPPSSLR